MRRDGLDYYLYWRGWVACCDRNEHKPELSAQLYPLLDLERYKWLAEIASTSSHPEQTNLNAQTNRFSHNVSRWAESFTRTSDQPPFRPLTSASYLSSVIDVLAGDSFGESIRGLAAQTHRREFRLSSAGGECKRAARVSPL